MPPCTDVSSQACSSTGPQNFTHSNAAPDPSSSPSRKLPTSVTTEAIPLALAMQVPGCFRLAAASVTLAGLDLPRLLPRACAAPRHDALVGVLDDAETACAAIARRCGQGRHMGTGATAQQLPARDECTLASNGAGDGDSETARVSEQDKAAPEGTRQQMPGEQQEVQRIARWAIKRVIRSAGELVQDSARAHSRDLYWCCELNSRHAARTLRQLESQQPHAMTAHVRLSMCDALLRAHERTPRVVSQAEDQISSEAAAALSCLRERGAQNVTWEQLAHALATCLWCLLNVYVAAPDLPSAQLQRAVLAARHVATALDAAALFSMTAVPNDWLPKRHSAYHMQEVSKTPSRVRKYSAARMPQPLLRARRRVAASVAAMREAVLQVTARLAAERKQLHTGLAGASPLTHSIPVRHSVLEIDCCSAAGRAASAEHFAALSADALALATAAPVVLRGGCAAWRAVGGSGGGGGGWSVDALVAAAGAAQGRVRVAPTEVFPFVQPRVAAALAAIAGEAALPSTTRDVRILAITTADLHVSLLYSVCSSDARNAQCSCLSRSSYFAHVVPTVDISTRSRRGRDCR